MVERKKKNNNNTNNKQTQTQFSFFKSTFLIPLVRLKKCQCFETEKRERMSSRTMAKLAFYIINNQKGKTNKRL